MVREENGRASGTLTARFKMPPGSTGDPVVKFEFTGEFNSARNQVFNLTTSDGAKGTIELIPGPAFNLLEVNFQTEAKPGKIRQAQRRVAEKVIYFSVTDRHLHRPFRASLATWTSVIQRKLDQQGRRREGNLRPVDRSACAARFAIRSRWAT